MDINDLFDGIIKSIKQFAFGAAEQRRQERRQESGRGPENRGMSSQNREPKEKRGRTDFPKEESLGRKARYSKTAVNP